jgi:hypothetical protein
MSKVLERTKAIGMPLVTLVVTIVGGYLFHERRALLRAFAGLVLAPASGVVVGVAGAEESKDKATGDKAEGGKPERARRTAKAKRGRAQCWTLS